MGLKDYIAQYPGKTLQEIVELENEAERQSKLQAQEQKLQEEAFWAEILQHKFYKINFNGLSISFVEVFKCHPNTGISCNEINTYIDSCNSIIKLDKNRVLNILWFRGKGANVEKITHEQYLEAVTMLQQSKELIESIR